MSLTLYAVRIRQDFVTELVSCPIPTIDRWEDVGMVRITKEHGWDIRPDTKDLGPESIKDHRGRLVAYFDLEKDKMVTL